MTTTSKTIPTKRKRASPKGKRKSPSRTWAEADMTLSRPIPSDPGTITLNDYQDVCKQFIAFPDKFTITYPALLLASETGEVCDKIHKCIRDQKDLNYADLPTIIMPELGDVLWAVAILAQNLGLSLEEIAVANLEKLKDRKERNAIKGSGDDR